MEANQLPFFDFFRDWAFGFVENEDGRGFYARVQYAENDIIHASCSCRDGRSGRLCAHALAVHLRVLNWPLDRLDLSSRFESWYLFGFFKELDGWMRRSQHLCRPLDSGCSDALGMSRRMTAYFGVSDPLPAVTKRDRQIREEVMHAARSVAEREMIQRGLKSARVLFEESAWYSVAKLFFLASLVDALHTTACLKQGHLVRITMVCGQAQVFTVDVPIEVFVKIAQERPQIWGSQMDFTIQRRALPTVYEIRFLPSGDLEIQSGVRISEATIESVADLTVQSAKNLFFHPSVGYFQMQIGLSPFELTFSDGATHVIPSQSVAAFLKEHQETLQDMDREFMDPLIFEELIVTGIDRLKLKLTSFNGQAFRTHIEASASSAAFNLTALRKVRDASTRFVKLSGRLIDTHSSDWRFISALLDDSDPFHLTIQNLFRLTGYFAQRFDIDADAQTQSVFDQLKHQSATDPPDLRHTRLELRPYQRLGYRWLYFLHAYQLGGLLCDQMGLGKTHQVMALMAAVLKENPQAAILVICPASVIYHWQRLLHDFGEFPTHVHHGPERHKEQLDFTARITLTTYPTMRNDQAEFLSTPFDLIAFDEIQLAKNPSTQTHQAAAALKASMKIGMTGTPIENSVTDLKALMDLVLPGYLGTDAAFRRHFEIPILRYRSRSARRKLRDIAAPFTLRRTKPDVLPELPPVTEDRRIFSLSPYERTLYDTIRNQGKSGLSKVKPSSKTLHIFSIINQLKQLCDHPALLFNRTDYTAFPAAKWQLFTDILHEALNSGDKVVVFTQYLGMITLFQKYLINHRIEFACVTGKTRDRKHQLESFQSDDTCRVFLGTIRASGMGVDLQAGRVLIHYDRWWNPAREDQVTSRIHRMGQERGVQVFHLLSKDTIEERIDDIIASKRELLADVVQIDEMSLGKILTIEELLAVLE